LREQRWTNEADVVRNALRRRLPTGGRPSSVPITRTVSGASTATSATVVAGSRSGSVSSELLTSKYGASDVENDANVLISKLHAAEAERDAALAELARVRRRVAHSLALPDTNADAGKNSTSLDDGGETEDWAFTHQVRLDILHYRRHPQILLINTRFQPMLLPETAKRVMNLWICSLPGYYNNVAIVPQIYILPDRTQRLPNHIPSFVKHRLVLTCTSDFCILSLPQRAVHPSSASIIREPSPFPRDVSSTLSPAALEQMRFDILATLPIPAYYPSEPLRPILMPTKMDLEGFLDHSTGVGINW